MKPADEWHLPTRRLGRRTFVFNRLDSTNTYAVSQADDPANDGLVVLAREQTAGRGQCGRTWQAPAGSSVLLSILLFPPPALRRPASLTAWAAVSVCETILRLTGLQAKIKWPNDVLIRGRKVCGILIEQRTVASGQWPVASDSSSLAPGPWPLATVCGIGLNLNQTAEHFTATGLEQAASFALFTDRQYDCDAVACRLIRQLDDAYDRLCQGDLHSLEASWRHWLGLQDQLVVAECADREWYGRLIEVAWDGVSLETASGLVRLLPEMVRHLRRQSGPEA